MKLQKHDLRKEDFSSWLSGFLDCNNDFLESLVLARNNSEGKIWLIGGSVYRPLAFGDNEQAKDTDFIVEQLIEGYMPKEYFEFRNRFGGLKLVGRERRVDLMQLSSMRQIILRGAEPKIENYLALTPLNIQSIAYDVAQRIVMGEIGKQAVVDRVVRVNDMQMAEDTARMYKKSVRDIVLHKAMELDFHADLSELV